nr:AI-2E family transporter [Flavihumibacter solisilvae]
MIFFSAVILYFGKTLFIPLFFGLFIAIVLYPICHWLEKRHVHRTIAITLSISIVVLLFALLVWLLILQAGTLHRDWPELQRKFDESLPDLQQWIQDSLGITVPAQNRWWRNALTNVSTNAGSMITEVFGKTTSGVLMLLITPVFTALFLNGRRNLVLFLEKVTGERFRHRLHTILHETIHTYFHFIKGMILVYIIVGILNSLGLLALGIRYAILFGFLTAIMTIIPYVGIIVAAFVPITIAWVTKDSLWYPAGVIIVFSVVQYLEANVIFPRVVGTQLDVNTWIILAAAIAGGILWGASGMILFIPFVGILKLVSAHIPEWSALHTLLSRNKGVSRPRL